MTNHISSATGKSVSIWLEYVKEHGNEYHASEVESKYSFHILQILSFYVATPSVSVKSAVLWAEQVQFSIKVSVLRLRF